ncbi:unnamed protein product [Protopolystoma xenopodis]|uniref:Uncharacterized protein n=1 Tax=Protopolystoma xenopodis TaxID=117903 RepID=A0A3S5ACJ7_9PLAT|nr:unnamed protein product [Protopolystoma xenopodis]
MFGVQAIMAWLNLLLGQVFIKPGQRDPALDGYLDSFRQLAHLAPLFRQPISRLSSSPLLPPTKLSSDLVITPLTAPSPRHSADPGDSFSPPTLSPPIRTYSSTVRSSNTKFVTNSGCPESNDADHLMMHASVDDMLDRLQQIECIIPSEFGHTMCVYLLIILM